MKRSYEASSTESLTIWGVVSSPSSRGGPDMSSETALTGSAAPSEACPSNNLQNANAF